MLADRVVDGVKRERDWGVEEEEEGGARAVAMTISPRSRSWDTNSRPIPREAPTMSQVCGGMLVF